MSSIKMILFIVIICSFQCNEAQNLDTICINNTNKELDYVWGKIDGFLDEHKKLIFSGKYYFLVNYIRPNGVIIIEKFELISQYFSGVPEIRLISKFYTKIFIFDKNNVTHLFQGTQSIQNFNLSRDLPFIIPYNSDGFKKITNMLFIGGCKYKDKTYTYCPYVYTFYKHNGNPIAEFIYHNTIELENSYIKSEAPRNYRFVVTSAYLDSQNKTENPLNSFNNYTIFQSMHNFDGNYQSNVGAMYRLNINEKFDTTNVQTNSFDSKPFRVSTYRPNQMWFGCPASLCMYSAIDDIANAFNDTLYVFSGAFFWRWNASSGEYPRVRDAMLLQTQFQYIDAAFTDTQTSITYLFKANRVLRFNDNHYDSKYDTPITDEFKDLHFHKTNAAIFDSYKNQLYVYNPSSFMVYEKKSQITSGSISDSGLPNNFNAAFTDDNGDMIFIKKNIAYRREYGSFKPFLIQQYFMCDISYNYSRIGIPEISSWDKFKTDIETYEKLEVIPTKVTIWSTPKYSTTNTGETISQQFTKTTSLSVDNKNTKSTVKTKTTPKQKNGFKLWQFILIVVLFVFAILITILCYVGGYCCGKSDDIEEKRKLFKDIIEENKKDKNKPN